MIDSILDRQRRSIVIDKLLVKVDNQTTELITEPDRIKEVTVRHFQTCALPLNSPPPIIPSHWQQQFESKSYVNADIYTPATLEISQQEWHDCIRHLANDKASRPSDISNEMIKHLSNLADKSMLHLANICLSIDDFLEE